MTNYWNLMILHVWKSGLPFSSFSCCGWCVWVMDGEKLLKKFYKLLFQRNGNNSTMGSSVGSPWCGCEGDKLALLVSLCPSRAEWCAQGCWEGSTSFPPPASSLQHNRTCTLRACLSQHLYFILSFNANWTDKQNSKKISLFAAANLGWCWDQQWPWHPTVD